MGRPIQPWTLRLREVLDEGPRPVEELVMELAALVPPGRAFREGEYIAGWVREKRNVKSSRPVRNKEQLKDTRIHYGQRRIVRSMLRTQVQHGRVEKYEVDGVAWVRKGANPWPDATPKTTRKPRTKKPVAAAG